MDTECCGECNPNNRRQQESQEVVVLVVLASYTAAAVAAAAAAEGGTALAVVPAVVPETLVLDSHPSTIHDHPSLWSVE